MGACAAKVAVIDEAVCIGCARCIPACPVDAILGASQLMHTVIASECTGCARCIAPCPVDCIAMVPLAVAPGHDDRLRLSAQYRGRTQARRTRLAREAREAEAERARRRLLDPVAEALARAKRPS